MRSSTLAGWLVGRDWTDGIVAVIPGLIVSIYLLLITRTVASLIANRA